MPLIARSSYLPPPAIFKNPHVNTIYPALFRKVKDVVFNRERINLPDGDFLDVDWASKSGAFKTIICLHGLEGNAERHYMAGVMKRFILEGWDAAGINMRGCGGEDNRLLHGYHSGKSEDLEAVISRIQSKYENYQTVVIVGFSVGGNIALKYAGEQGSHIPEIVKAVVAFSVPCDLAGCSKELELRKNRFYQWQFLVTLKRKVKEKYRKFPGSFNLERVLKAKFFKDFDDHFTGPVNGFKDAQDYWAKISCIPFLRNIAIPTLLVNAKDDSFLNADSYPVSAALENRRLFLEMPDYGGHLGFMPPNKNGFLWSEERAWEFVREHGLA